LLLINWIAEGRMYEKISLLRRNPAILILASLFMVYLLGLLNSENMAAGLSRVKNALPLLILPVVMATSIPLNERNFRRLLLLFVLSVSIAAIICLIYYFKSDPSNDWDFREISLFMSHIRFSLLIVMSILILLYLAFFDDYFRKLQIYLLIASLLLTGFLIFLRSITGITLFISTILVFIVVTAYHSPKRFVRYGFLFMVLAFLTLLFSVTFFMITRFFKAPSVNLSGLDSLTANGSPYNRPTDLSILENGNYVGIYICEKELSREWNNVSTIPYNSIDHRGQFISYTIKRYLTSKGLRKDSVGIHQLKSEDIAAIEKGCTNYLFTGAGLIQRYYETLWEIHVWHKTGYVQQHSFSQRIVFLQSALSIIRQNPFTGIGIGDVYSSMLRVTRDNNIGVEYKWEGKPHNQFAFVFMATGIFGFGWFVFALLYPAIKKKLSGKLLFNLFMILILISMVIIDTLESYDSIVFFVFFYSLFLTCEDKKNLMTAIDHQVNS